MAGAVVERTGDLPCLRAAYSRRYFKSEHRGKEWFAFNRRRPNHNVKNASPAETIVPAP